MRRTSPSIELFGQSVPLAVVGLMLVVFVASLVLRSPGAVSDALPLVPDRVLQGELWRLVSWSLLVPEPWSLAMCLLTLAWLGGELSASWGVAGLLRTLAALAVGTGLVLTLMGAVHGPLGSVAYGSAWAVTLGLMAAWSRQRPEATLLLLFVVPISARHVLPLLFGGTVVAMFLERPWWGLLPHLIALSLVALMGLLVGPRAAETAWLRLRFRFLEWHTQRKRSHLRVVERPKDDGDEPPRWVH